MFFSVEGMLLIVASGLGIGLYYGVKELMYRAGGWKQRAIVAARVRRNTRAMRKQGFRV